MRARAVIADPLTGSESLVDRVGHAVRGAILDGRLRPGEALSISDLVRDLNVSHSPVREALQRLSAQGLIVLRPARTPVVAPLDLGELEEIYRLRVLIEVDALGRAAPLLSELDLERVSRHFERLSRTATDSDAFWDAHTAFHRHLMSPVMTPRLDRVISELWHAAERYIRIVYIETDVLFARSPRDHHTPLMEAASRRDAEALRSRMAEHLRSNHEEVAASLQRILPESPSDREPPGPREP